MSFLFCQVVGSKQMADFYQNKMHGRRIAECKFWWQLKMLLWWLSCFKYFMFFLMLLMGLPAAAAKSAFLAVRCSCRCFLFLLLLITSPVATVNYTILAVNGLPLLMASP